MIRAQRPQLGPSVWQCQDFETGGARTFQNHISKCVLYKTPFRKSIAMCANYAGFCSGNYTFNLVNYSLLDIPWWQQ